MRAQTLRNPVALARRRYRRDTASPLARRSEPSRPSWDLVSGPRRGAGTFTRRANSQFSDVGAAASVLHSRIDGDRTAILDWVRATEDAVLVSVGMLTEAWTCPRHAP